MSNNIGNNIRDKRIELGISQTELADKLNVTKGNVCQIEKGDRNISVSKLEKVSEILNCEITELLKG